MQSKEYLNITEIENLRKIVDEERVKRRICFLIIILLLLFLLFIKNYL
jgi:hypothetical protein